MLKKIQKLVLSLLVVYGILGFFILPYILKSQITKLVSQQTNSKISIQSIYFNPFVFTIRISGVKLETLDKKPLLLVKSINADFELHSLFNSAIHLKDFTLQEPKIYFVLNKDKTINLAKIIKKRPEEKVKEDNKTATKLPRIILDEIAIKNGTLNYKDHTQKDEFNFSFHDIGFELKDIDSDNFNKSDEEIRFYTLLGDGGFIDIKTDIISINPLKLKGSLDFKASKLYTEWRYLKDSLNLEVADGKVALYGEYSFDLADLDATTIKNLSISLDSLRIKPKHGFKDVLNLHSLHLSGITLKPILQDIKVKNIALNNLHIKIKKDSKGDIDWVEYLKHDIKKKDTNTTTQDNKKSTLWKVDIEKIALKKISVDFYDKSIKPAVDTNLNEFNLYLQNVTLAGKKPLNYQIDLRLNDKFICSSQGDLTYNTLNLNTYLKCSGFDITHYNPYINQAANNSLKVYDLDLKSAKVDFDLNGSVKDIKDKIFINVTNANLGINNVSLNKKSTKENLLKFKKFNLKGVSLDTKTKEIKISDSVLSSLNIKTKRLQNGGLNIQNLIIPHAKKSVKTKQNKKEKQYKLSLKHFGLKSSQVSFDDQVLSPSVKTKLKKINLDLYNISSMNKSWLEYTLNLKLNNSGVIKAKGELRHTPLKQKGSFSLSKITLKNLTPYIQQKASLSIDDGFLSVKGKTTYAKQKNKPDLTLDGSLKLESLFVSDSRDKTPLLSFSKIDIKPFTYEMSPNRLFMNEINLNSFYVNAIVHKDKTMNFASLIKPTSDKKTTKKEDTNQTKGEDFPIKIMKLNVTNGSAKFADESLPIEFRTNIHDLNGVVYAISNEKDATSFVDISGEVDKYGSTKLKGSINTANPKAYTQLDFNFRNLNLSSVSGYSASFAGYEIDKGKLYLDLGYDITNSELVGKNSIIIKNIKLGKEFKDENTTSLPLGFVIALLEDSDGIIDIDMPVEGNVDEPDFKYGKLIWKTFANLIVKAVSSPFKFLGSMMGIDGEKLKYIDFEYGLSKILPPEKEKLDTIAKMMIKRPKISLCISGKYDVLSDKSELQKEKLITLLLKKSGIKNAQQHKNIMTVELLEGVYTDLRNDDKLDKIKLELKKTYKDGEFKRAYLNALIKVCIQIQPLSTDELKTLALNRADTIKSYLVDKKSIKNSRIKILKISSVEKHDEKYSKTKLEIVVK